VCAFSNIDIMIPTTHALLIWVLFLCAQEETVQSQRGHCTGNQCFALFQELGDFAEAQKRCKDSGGHSLMVNSEHVEKLLKSPLSGSYWLKHDKNAAAGSQSCPCISVSEGRNITMLSKPCRDTLDGFLCLYTFDEPCSGLQMELDDKETFPPGTIGGCEYNCSSTTGGCCACRKGFRVSPHDPTKCEMICTERDCPSICVPDNANELKCFCIHGYIQDVNPNDTLFCTDIDECESGGHDCAHQCENLLGSYRCLCNEGFKLLPNNYECVQEQEEDDDGSGSTAPYPSPASPRPATVVPFYIKTGSAMGITVFIALCAVLLYFLIRNVVKRCGKFELSSFKHPDIDIFYLQQVTTETYKRMSFDKQFKNDSPTIL
uniref:EGF-like domain-containing protein n=1 Tax=Sander lucioperca TaxID=283035 RepID=A0A8C9ZE03_SANLU